MNRSLHWRLVVMKKIYDPISACRFRPPMAMREGVVQHADSRSSFTAILER